MIPAPGVQSGGESCLYADGLGERFVLTDTRTGGLVQVLHVHPALAMAPAFEFALRERAAYLSRFSDPAYARVHRVERVSTPEPGLAITSDHVEGARLSTLLAAAQRADVNLATAISLLRQIVPAVALLHRSVRGVAHGLIAPERLVLTPSGRVVVVEHVFGSAIERLLATPERLWKDFRIAVRPGPGPVRLDEHADIIGLAVVALALVLRRPLDRDDCPHVAAAALLDEARARTENEHPLGVLLCDWLAQALHVDGAHAFSTTMEAAQAFQRVVEDTALHLDGPESLERLLSGSDPALHETTPVDAVDETPRRDAPAAPADHAQPVGRLDLDEIDWGAIVERQTTVVATARDISELFSDSRAPAPSEPVQEEQRFETCEPPEALHTPAVWPDDPAIPTASRSALLRSAAAAVLLVMTLGGAYLVARARPGGAADALDGMLLVRSTPAGLQVLVDGLDRGMTPASIPLAPGEHTLEVRGPHGTRTIPFTLAAGGEASHHLEFAETAALARAAPSAPQAPAPGRADTSAGPGPLTGKPAPPVPAWGWLSIAAPFPLDVHAGGRPIGTSQLERIRMAPGRHEILLVNASLGYREVRVVQVTQRRVTRIAVEPPVASVSFNASPWAEVWVDGRRIGETPLGNVQIAAGRREVVFRHPQFGEKRQSIMVTAGRPVRIAVEMR